MSAATKSVVHFGLYAGTLKSLGTKKHENTFIKQAYELKDLGCFMMTELGHGSNV